MRVVLFFLQWSLFIFQKKTKQNCPPCVVLSLCCCCCIGTGSSIESFVQILWSSKSSEKPVQILSRQSVLTFNQPVAWSTCQSEFGIGLPILENFATVWYCDIGCDALIDSTIPASMKHGSCAEQISVLERDRVRFYCWVTHTFWRNWCIPCKLL